MPSPLTWDITKPAGSDALSIGDDQIRADKTTVRDVLRTLVPYGAPTTAWRVVQIDNGHFIVQNAKYDGTNWSHDDTGLDASGIYLPNDGSIRLIYRKANASTWLTAAWIAAFITNSVAAAVNYLQIDSAAAGSEPTLLAVGSDADIDLLLKPKGAGRPRSYGAGASGPYDVPVVLDRDVTPLNFGGVDTEMTVYTFTVPANILGTTRALRLQAQMTAKWNVAGTLTIRVKYGAETIYTSSALDPADNAAFRPILLDVILFAGNATNVQRARTHLTVGAPGVTGGGGSPAIDEVAVDDAVGVDSTQGFSLVVTTQWSAVDAGLNGDARHFTLELI